MKLATNACAFILFVLLCGFCYSSSDEDHGNLRALNVGAIIDDVLQQDRLLFADSSKMAAARAQLRYKNDQELDTAYQQLIKQAEKALKQVPVSVLNKTHTPPSGDMHDFLSRSPYWWPDPTKPDGLPYIWRDGERNPEAKSITDATYLKRMIKWVDTLGKAYAFSGKKSYARKAAKFMRTWFLEEDTRMNPNLEFAGAIPGRSDGRYIGIINTRDVGLLFDAIYLIQPSGLWTEEDEAGMQAWCRNYLEWLLTSENGKKEAATHNNHGTFYDLQAAALAFYTGKVDVAKVVALFAKTRRIDGQLADDGSQPKELTRTKAWHYSTWNLKALFLLARLAEHAGVDLYSHKTPSGADLKSALDFLLPFALEEKEWPYKEIGGFSPNRLLLALDLAARAYPDDGYSETAQLLRDRYPSDNDFWRLW